MPLDAEFKAYREAHDALIVAMDGFRNKKIKGRATDCRKAMQEIALLMKVMRGSVMEEKEKM